MHIRIPQINKSSRSRGVQRILEALSPVFEEQEPVSFDFTNCYFISAEGIALLTGAKLMRDSRGFSTKIDMGTIYYPVERVLAKFRFLDLFGYGRELRSASNTLPIYRERKFSGDSKENMFQYIDGEILKRSEMPEMSDDLRKEVRKAFSEVFGNIFHHSESPIGGIVCGQVYPNSKEIQIVFYDAGVGIARHVREVEYSISSDEKAIEWSLRRGTSTHSDSSEPRGLGLFLLRQFLIVNGGELHIYANQGALTEISGNCTYNTLPCELKGTLVDMRIKIRNDVKYAFSYEE